MIASLEEEPDPELEEEEPGGTSYCEKRLKRDKRDLGLLFSPEGGSGTGREDVGTEYDRGDMVGLEIMVVVTTADMVLDRLPRYCRC